MAAIATSTLLAATTGYACYGATVPQLLELGLIQTALLAKYPTSNVTAAALLSYAQVYACYGATVPETFALAMLSQLAQ